MKRIFLAIIVLLAIVVCSFRLNVGARSYTETFMEKPGDKSSIWFEVIHKGESTSLLFYGRDTLMNGTIVYYKSIAKELKITKDEIRFKLNKYAVSPKPFNNDSDSGIYSTDINKVPGLLLATMYFWTEKTKDGLKLFRTSDFYYNRSDAFSLMKIK